MRSVARLLKPPITPDYLERSFSTGSPVTAPLPGGGFVRGTGFVVQSLCGLGLVGLGAVEPQCAVASRCKNIAR